MAHSDLDGFKRTKEFTTEFPFFSKEERPEFRRKRDFYEPLLTAMAQVLPSLNTRTQIARFGIAERSENRNRIDSKSVENFEKF